MVLKIRSPENTPWITAVEIRPGPKSTVFWRLAAVVADSVELLKPEMLLCC